MCLCYREYPQIGEYQHSPVNVRSTLFPLDFASVPIQLFQFNARFNDGRLGWTILGLVRRGYVGLGYLKIRF